MDCLKGFTYISYVMFQLCTADFKWNNNSCLSLSYKCRRYSRKKGQCVNTRPTCAKVVFVLLGLLLWCLQLIVQY